MQEETKQTETTSFPTKETVLQNQDKIKLLDTDENTGLELYSYLECTNNDTETVKQSRGLVFHGDKLVLKTFPYSTEFTADDRDNIERELSGDWDTYRFYTSYEGTLLRLFNFQGKWYLSTHRKLNAFKSKWSSKDSFGTLFKRALEHEMTVSTTFKNRINETSSDLTSVLEKYQSTLNENYQYVFLVRNTTENRIVCDPPVGLDPFVYHVGTFVGEAGLDQAPSEARKLILTEDAGLPYPKRHNFKNIDELLDYVYTCDPRRIQGVMCFNAAGVPFKVLNPEYNRMFMCRGNEPSVKFRYLQVRMSPDLTDQLYQLYPEHVPAFEEYENYLYEIAQYIHGSYRARFIRHEYAVVPREEYEVVKQCHSWYQENPKENRVNLEKVIEIMNKQSPVLLNRMIRHHTYELRQENSQDNSSVRWQPRPQSHDHTPVVLKRLNL